jgi:hypothetical protein
MVVEGLVDLGAHPPDDAVPAPGQEVRGLAVAEKGVQPAVEEHAALEPQRGNPQRVVSMQAERKVDESLEISAA